MAYNVTQDKMEEMLRGQLGPGGRKGGAIGSMLSFEFVSCEAEKGELVLRHVVPQAAALPPGYTVYETVSHGRTPYLNWYGKLSENDQNIIDQAIHITGLDPFKEKDVSTLSGGEQQRVILARALTQNAPVMILDEPTSSLDIHYQVALLSLEKEICLREGIAAVFIIHDLNLAARFADRIAILHNGTLAAVGTPDEVLKEDILSMVYDIPVRILKDPEEGLIILPRIPDKI